MSKRYVYMDYAATTYTKPEVLSEMMPYFGKDFGNPSSVHEYGRVAKKAQEQARAQIGLGHKRLSGAGDLFHKRRNRSG